jgi:arsenite oxidase large subunit
LRRRTFLLAGGGGLTTVLLGDFFPGRVFAQDATRAARFATYPRRRIARLSELAADRPRDDWKDANDVFEQAARFGRGGVLNYHPLVVHARKLGVRAHDLLRRMGTHGIQTPIRHRMKATEPEEYLTYVGSFRSDEVPGMLVGTKRLHDHETDFGEPQGPTVHAKWLTAFASHSGKAVLHKSPWELFGDFFDRIKPRGEELWVTCGRVNEIWQSAFDDKRRPYIMQRWPQNWIEIHPADAGVRGIESGDLVRVENDDVLVQTGEWVAVEEDDFSYTKLEKAGHIRIGKGALEAVAVVTDAVRPGVTWTNFLDLGSPVNSLVPRVPDPITNRYRFKLGKGRVRKIGESPYKRDLSRMTFLPRTII